MGSPCQASCHPACGDGRICRPLSHAVSRYCHTARAEARSAQVPAWRQSLTALCSELLQVTGSPTWRPFQAVLPAKDAPITTDSGDQMPIISHGKGLPGKYFAPTPPRLNEPQQDLTDEDDLSETRLSGLTQLPDHTCHRAGPELLTHEPLQPLASMPLHAVCYMNITASCSSCLLSSPISHMTKATMCSCTFHRLQLHGLTLLTMKVVRICITNNKSAWQHRRQRQADMTS